MRDHLSWTHYRILLPLKSLDEIKYYIHITETQSLSYRKLKELGTCFSYIGHEVKIKINNNYHSIDFLLYNYEFNLFVVCEIKVTKMKPEYIGQVLKYINYVDKNIKKNFQDNTARIII